MHTKQIIHIGKAFRAAARLRGGGTALPGLVVEKLDKQFVGKMLAGLPRGVVVISGTNGKTTTTKIVSELLQASGLKVFTNKTGSNFVRGIAAAILGEVDNSGKLPHDIAVLELDEAHAVQFIKHAPVQYALILNVMRDQLDRFGEIDYTARLLRQVAAAAETAVVLNRDDPRVCDLASSVKPKVAVTYFGADPKLHGLFVNDDMLHQSLTEQPVPPADLKDAAVELKEFAQKSAVFAIGGEEHKTALQLSGVYNYLNAAGALALCKAILAEKSNNGRLIGSLAEVRPAFGRGEILQVGDRQVELVLVKNPAGFRLALASFGVSNTGTMIAINDNYADGRDMSWLWDVDFTSLKPGGVHTVAGIRAYDMALRLQYDEVGFNTVQTDLKQALQNFLSDNASSDLRIYCTYTAMLKLRRLLRKYTKLEIMG